MPKERSFTSFDAGISTCTTPSGLVPGGGVGARAQKLHFISGGQGLDGIFLFYFEVLYAKLEDYIVIFIFFRILLVKCITNADV
jgi:hypothetical protein